MMRKALHTAMALLVMISTTGMAINTHYCGNREVGKNLVVAPPAESCCPVENAGCCHNKIEYFHVGTDFQLNTPLHYQGPVQDLIAVQAIPTHIVPISTKPTNIGFAYDRPPNLRFYTTPSFLQVFRL